MESLREEVLDTLINEIIRVSARKLYREMEAAVVELDKMNYGVVELPSEIRLTLNNIIEDKQEKCQELHRALYRDEGKNIKNITVPEWAEKDVLRIVKSLSRQLIRRLSDENMDSGGVQG